MRTIDSLLFAILKGLSFELGIRPEARVLFNEEKILDEAFEVLLARLNDRKDLWEEALNTYLVLDERGGFYPESGLKRRLFELYPKAKGDLKSKKVNPSAINKAERDLRKAYTIFYRVSNLKAIKPYLNGNKFKKFYEKIEFKKLTLIPA